MTLSTVLQVLALLVSLVSAVGVLIVNGKVDLPVCRGPNRKQDFRSTTARGSSRRETRGGVMR